MLHRGRAFCAFLVLLTQGKAKAFVNGKKWQLTGAPQIPYKRFNGQKRGRQLSCFGFLEGILLFSAVLRICFLLLRLLRLYFCLSMSLPPCFLPLYAPCFVFRPLLFAFWAFFTPFLAPLAAFFAFFPFQDLFSKKTALLRRCKPAFCIWTAFLPPKAFLFSHKARFTPHLPFFIGVKLRFLEVSRLFAAKSLSIAAAAPLFVLVKRVLAAHISHFCR